MRPIVILVALVSLATPHPVRGQAAANKVTETAPAHSALPEDLASLFPAQTDFYLDCQEALATLAQARMVESLARYVATLGDLREAAPSGSDLRLLLTARVVFGVFEPEPESGQKPGGRTGGVVVRFPSAEAAAKGHLRVLRTLQRGSDEYPVATTINIGKRTVDVHGRGQRQFGWALVDRDLVGGEQVAVTALLRNAGRPAVNRLSGLPSFTAAMRRFPSRQSVLGYVDLQRVVGEAQQAADGITVGGGTAAEHGTAQRGLTEAEREVRQRRAAEREFTGYACFRALSFSLDVDNAGVRGRWALSIDRSRPGLLQTLTNPPTIAARAADFLPADTDTLLSGGFDLQALFDLALKAPYDDVVEAFGLDDHQQAIEVVRMLESQFGVSYRNDLLAGMSGEIAIGLGLGSGPTNFALLISECQRPDVARRLFQALSELGAAGGESGVVKSEFAGAELWEFRDRAWATIDGIAVAGSQGAVRRALEAHATGTTLANNPTYVGLSRGVPRVVSGLAYLSPKAIGMVSETTGLFGRRAPALGTPTGLALWVENDEGVLTGEAVLSVGDVATQLDAAVVDMQLGRNEAQAVQHLYLLAGSQDRFRQDQNRYGTLDELAAAGVVEQAWREGHAYQGYRFSCQPSNDGAESSFEISAVPVTYGKTGTRSLLLVLGGPLRAADHNGGPASREDPPLYDRAAEEMDARYEVLVPVIATANLLASMRTREANARTLLARIAVAEARYRQTHQTYTSIAELGAAGLLQNSPLLTGAEAGYTFWVRPAADTFEAGCEPLTYGETGNMSFFIDESGTMRGGDKGGNSAGIDDPEVNDW